MATSYQNSGREIPSGVIDGVNTVFTLVQAPLPINSLQLYMNGQLLPVGTTYDRSGLIPYTLSGNVATLKDPPQPGDELVAYYSYSSSISSTTTTTAKASPVDLTTVDIVKSWLNTAGKPSASSATEEVNIQRCVTAASRYWLWRTGRGDLSWQNAQASPFNQPVQYNEWYDGNGNDQLFLRNTPILSVEALAIDGRAVSLSQSPRSMGFTSFPSQVVYRQGVFCRGRKNVNVQYTAGFDVLAVTAEIQTVPTVAPFELQAFNLPWLENVGIAYFADGTPLTVVTTDPARGQYFIEGSGRYLFSSDDAGQKILINYSAAGTPEDVRLACTQMVAVNYKRRNWIDQASQAMASGAGTVSYRNWELPPEVMSVINAYTRRAI